jgi:hypothetical protein
MTHGKLCGERPTRLFCGGADVSGVDSDWARVNGRGVRRRTVRAIPARDGSCAGEDPDTFNGHFCCVRGGTGCAGRDRQRERDTAACSDHARTERWDVGAGESVAGCGCPCFAARGHWGCDGGLFDSCAIARQAKALTQRARSERRFAKADGQQPYSVARVRLLSVPMPSISMTISSLSSSQRWGVRPRPTPGGVPVLMMSPDSSGVMLEM